jgi:hypothetical protein
MSINKGFLFTSLILLVVSVWYGGSAFNNLTSGFATLSIPNGLACLSFLYLSYRNFIKSNLCSLATASFAFCTIGYLFFAITSFNSHKILFVVEIFVTFGFAYMTIRTFKSNRRGM